MAGRAYSVFDTAIGRCGMVWGEHGILGLQLPEAREIETRGRLLRRHPDARDLKPPLAIERAIEGIRALMRGEPSELADVALDMSGLPGFTQRVYALTRAIPRGETRSYGELAKRLGASGAVHAVTQALARNPFVIIVPCHRVHDGSGFADKMSPNGGVISKRRLLSIEGATRGAGSLTLFDALLPPVPPRPPG
jgi:methylated-DNA-[protein]-cysteine S-methyltransferase